MLQANNPATNNGTEYQANGEWSCSYASVGFQDKTSFNAKATGLVRSINHQSPNHLVWTVTKGSNTTDHGKLCKATDYLDVYNNSFEITDMPNFITCGPSATLIGEEAGHQNSTYSGAWTRISGPGKFTTATTNYTVSVENLQKKENTFRWTVYRNGCSAFDDITVFNNEVEVDAGKDINSCDDVVQLNATPATWQEGLWEIEDAGPNTNFAETSTAAPANRFNTMSLYNGYVYGLRQGETVLRWTVSSTIATAADNYQYNGVTYDDEQTCSLSDLVSIFNDAPDPAVVYPKEIEICQEQTAAGEEVLLSASTVRDGWGVGHWEYYDGASGGTIVSPSAYQSKIDNLPYGESVWAWVVEKQGSNGLMCRKTDYVHVFNNYVEAHLNVSYDEVCTPETELNAVNPDEYPGATGWWEYENFAGLPAAKCPSIAVPSDYLTTATNLPSGRSNFIWHVTKGSGLCHSEITYSVDNNQVEAVIRQPDPQHRVICEPTVRLVAQEIPATATGTWSLIGFPNNYNINDANFASPNGLVTDVTGLNVQNADYSFRWTVEIGSGKCNKTDEITIKNNSFTVDADASEPNNGGATWEAPANVFVCGSSYQLQPSIPDGDYTYEWTITAGSGTFVGGTNGGKTSNAKIPTVIGLKRQSTEIHLLVKDNNPNGCQADGTNAVGDILERGAQACVILRIDNACFVCWSLAVFRT